MKIVRHGGESDLVLDMYLLGLIKGDNGDKGDKGDQGTYRIIVSAEDPGEQPDGTIWIKKMEV